VWGGGAGAISPYVPQVVGKWTNPILFGGASILLKKPQLMTIAGYQAGQALMMNGFSAGSSASVGYE